MYKMKVHKNTKKHNGIFRREFYCEFLPTQPLVGIKIGNGDLIGDDGVGRRMFRIEFGLLFVLFSYTNVDYSDLE